jgi:hypothetical protein
VGFGSFAHFGISGPYVKSARGEIEIFDKSSGEWERAQSVFKLAKGDIIRTASSSQIDLIAPGSYTMRIKENAEVEIASLSHTRINGAVSYELRHGIALIDICTSFRGAEFIVKTPTAEARALGTKFAVDVTDGKKSKTWVGVIDGEVEVKSTHKPLTLAKAQEKIIVKAGQKTEVWKGKTPVSPERLLEEEWKKLEDLYQLEGKVRVALIISTGKDRARELLRPCPIYVSDVEPRTIPTLLEEAITDVNKAIEKKDRAAHFDAIGKLEQIVEKYPSPSYNVQFLLFIGAYYSYIDLFEEAIATFDKVVDKYPKSSLASLAQAAKAIIYEEELKDAETAIEIYKELLKYYPNSPEAEKARGKLGI